MTTTPDPLLTHCVYKLFKKSTNELVYIGSGNESRPRASSTRSHVSEIRSLNESHDLRVHVSLPMTEEQSRRREALLIQKHDPVFNSLKPRIKRPPTLHGLTRIALTFPVDSQEEGYLSKIFSAADSNRGFLLVGEYFVTTPLDPLTVRFSFREYHSSSSVSVSLIPGPIPTVRIKCRFDNLPGLGKSFLQDAYTPLRMLDDLLKKSFFRGHLGDLMSRDIKVESVGVTTYEDFGSSRDPAFSLLKSIAFFKTPVEQKLISMATFLEVSISHSRRKLHFDSDSVNGLENLKIKKNSDGKSCYSQTFYKSGKDHLRVESIFFKPCLQQWCNAFYKEPTRKATVKFSINDLDPIFSNSSLLRSMTNQMSLDLGLRKLLLSPTMNQIRELISSPTTAPTVQEIISLWFKHTSSLSFHPVYTHKLCWPFISSWLPNPRGNREVLNKLNDDYGLDLTLPATYYSMLDELRISHHASMDERQALSHGFIGFHTGEDSLSHKVDQALKNIRELQAKFTHDLKSNTKFGSSLSKSKIARNLLSIPPT